MPPEINMHDIALWSVKLRKSLKIVFFYILNSTILFGMVGLLDKINFDFTKFTSLDHVMILGSFCKSKFRLVNCKDRFPPF